VRIFVYEFVTGGGLGGEPLPSSLVREGDMMLQALLADLAALPGLDVFTSRDPRLAPLPGAYAIVPARGENTAHHFARGVKAADAVWPIAPETGGTLERLARDTIDLGRTLIGCRPDALRIAASKRATVAALARTGIPVVPTFVLGEDVPPLPGPWVVKPDDGAGCEDTRRLPDWRSARELLTSQSRRRVAQPWIEGDTLSLSLLCREGRALLLSCNRQHVRIVEGRLVLAGISVNAVTDHDRRFARLADKIAAAIPGLWGYVGVDLILAQYGPVVLEVNPRLTTSYSRLGSALDVNPAALVLDLLRPDGGPRWRSTAGGRVEEISLESAGAD
jgi:predicted ATP-grasp superfamily ATP-dependent carboligase